MIELVCPACREAKVDDVPALSADGACPRCGARHDFTVTEASASESVWARYHWSGDDHWAWLRDLIEQLIDLPDGPALVLGAAACGEATAIPDGRHIVCLEADRGLLEHALWARESGVLAAKRLLGAQLICGNALDPPFRAEQFAVVVCLNLLDSVSDPEVLLGQCEALLKPSGALVLGSPYQFNEAVTPRERWLPELLGRPEDLPGAVEKLVTGAWDERFMATMRLQASERSLRWSLPVNDRFTAVYTSHVMLLRRLQGRN